ncbi:hypothetical protein SASPL_141593 [Salvia splendens]|uniref:Disease resistance protein RPM1 n=1 Tax=Salvia splendens TaxID=180675 RepID=A0A8X8WSF3_SALSN|nr:hypothetical protein SASPL_141593 [Salvia splendens]
MEGEAVAAVVKVLVQNLIDHTKNEISLIRGLNKEAEKLAWSLDTIQQLLNDAPGGAIKSWLRKLEDVAFDADNVLDELNYHLLSKQINSIKPMKQKVLSCFSPLSHIVHPRSIALKIQDINENLESIYKEGAGLVLEKRLANEGPNLPHAAFGTDSFSHDPIFIGRDELVSEIVEVINTGSATNVRVVSIFAIVGMGGLRKTTLTRNVFHHPKIKTHFGSHLWVHVSQIFDPIILFKKILICLTSTDQVKVESREDIMKKLQEALRDKTYLLILDDVWNQDRPKWDDFINSLVGVTSTKRNAIVITTRNMEVASTVQSLHTHERKGLSHEDCWSIIKAKTFEKEDIPSKFEAIGMKIATRCQGLPLAANVVGGALCNKSEEVWISIEEKWLSHDEGDHITKILKLSFDNLSLPSLKKCFVSCSLFPKGRKIKSQELIEYWMAEGFLEANGSSTRKLKELPSSLKYLVNLRHLYIKKSSLPAGIGSLTSLRTLEYFIVGAMNGCKIEELGSLNSLKGTLEISNLGRVENKEEAEQARLSDKSKIFKLRLTWNMHREVETTNDENVLEGLQPDSNMKRLEIEGFKGKRFPSWTGNMNVKKSHCLGSCEISSLFG